MIHTEDKPFLQQNKMIRMKQQTNVYPDKTKLNYIKVRCEGVFYKWAC